RQIVEGALLDRAAEVRIGPHLRGHFADIDVIADQLAFEIGVKLGRRGIMVRVGERSPAVEMNREMERLTAVPDEMAPNADIAQDQHLAPMPILGEPRAVFGGGGALLAGARDAPIGEILPFRSPACWSSDGRCCPSRERAGSPPAGMRPRRGTGLQSKRGGGGASGRCASWSSRKCDESAHIQRSAARLEPSLRSRSAAAPAASRAAQKL